MNTLGSLNENRRDFERSEAEHGRRPAAILIAVACLIVVALIAASYFIFFRQPAQSPAAQEQSKRDAPAAASTEAQIFEDEPVIKGSDAVVGGRVRNISREPLRDLSLELELKRRSDGSSETRTVTVEPNDLAPGAEGKYSISLPREGFSQTQIKHLKSAARTAFVIFKTAPGAPRPREMPNEPPTRTITIQRPSPRSKSEEFINTPDSPTKVH